MHVPNTGGSMEGIDQVALLLLSTYLNKLLPIYCDTEHSHRPPITSSQQIVRQRIIFVSLTSNQARNCASASTPNESQCRYALLVDSPLSKGLILSAVASNKAQHSAVTGCG